MLQSRPRCSSATPTSNPVRWYAIVRTTTGSAGSPTRSWTTPKLAARRSICERTAADVRSLRKDGPRATGGFRPSWHRQTIGCFDRGWAELGMSRSAIVIWWLSGGSTDHRSEHTGSARHCAQGCPAVAGRRSSRTAGPGLVRSPLSRRAVPSPTQEAACEAVTEVGTM